MEKEKITPQKQKKDLYIEEHGIDKKVKNGEYGVLKYGGQTWFYIPMKKFNRIGLQRIIKIINDIFKIDFNGWHAEYKYSHQFELPTILNSEKYDDQTMEELMEKLDEELNKK
jgi:hypothetical protein